MKVALVHELLTMKGGAENVLRILADIFPEAPIYTLLYDEQKLGEWFPKDRVRPSILQKNARSFNHHLYLKKFPTAVEAWDFSEFDLVISSSSAFAHGIITNGRPKHLSYVHSPARYLWDRTHDVQEKANAGLLGPLKKFYLSRTFQKLRVWDSEAAERPDVLIAPSKEVQKRISLYWRRESEVIHPPIDDVWIEKNPNPQSLIPNPYFFIASTLAAYKNIELAIDACNQLKLPLVIAGEGPHRKALEKRAGSTIKFVGFQSQDQLRSLYANAQATIFPGNEDFGLVPLESMACGTPVIAWKGGGALETIHEGKTGAFFEDQTTESLVQTLQSFDRKKFDADACIAQAKKFSRKNFEQGIQKAIKALMD
jgi:glycosyltransferase involved in cell wall biosynthesis